MLTQQREVVTWVLGLLAVGTICGLAIMVRQWRTGRLIIDRRQLLVRLLGGSTLLCIWTLLGFMLLYFDPRVKTGAWLTCFALTLALCVLLCLLSMLDLRLLTLNRLRAETRIAGEMSRLWKAGAATSPQAPHDA